MGRKKGFTLIELMIVSAVVLILAAVVIPKVESIRLYAKNRKVESNVLMVKAFLEDRRFMDRYTIYQQHEVREEPLAHVLSSVQDNVGRSMENTFTASRALDNPFTSSESIVYTEPDMSLITEDGSVIVDYDSGELYADEDSVSISIGDGERHVGKTIVTIYKDGYLGYGIGSDGRILTPFIIKMPEGNMYDVGEVPPPLPPTPPTPTDYEDLLGFYQYNALNVINPSGTSNFKGQEFNINGNTFILSDRIVFGTDVNTNNTENVALIANTIEKSWGNLNFGNRNFFLDYIDHSRSPIVPDINNNPIFYVPTNDVYKKFNPEYYFDELDDKNSYYKGKWPVVRTKGSGDKDYMLLNDDYTHFKSFELRRLPDNIIDILKYEEIGNVPPSNGNNDNKEVAFHYYDGPATINDYYLNDANGVKAAIPYDPDDKQGKGNQGYDIILCSGDLTIDVGQNNSFKFNGVIYCDGNLNIKGNNMMMTNNGIIITKGINVSGGAKLWVYYQTVPGTGGNDLRIQMIDNIFKFAGQ